MSSHLVRCFVCDLCGIQEYQPTESAGPPSWLFVEVMDPSGDSFHGLERQICDLCQRVLVENLSPKATQGKVKSPKVKGGAS